MSYQVFRVYRGSLLHIIHETLTGDNRVHNVHVLCEVAPRSGERDRGTPTCLKCLQLDNPCTLSDAERSMLARFALQAPLPPEGRVYGGQPVTFLHKKDLIDKNEKLTRRGDILAQDWREGAAPAADVAGVVHAREPLAYWPRCDRNVTLDGFDKMTVDRYARLRALGLHVTCVQCATLGFR